MNFFKRATTSILRRPGKTVILLLLVFILGSVIAGAISVEGAISNTDANLRRQMPPIVTTVFDQEAFSEGIDWDNLAPGEDPWRDLEVLTAEHVRSLGALDRYIERYDFVIRDWINTFELERYEGEHAWGGRLEDEPNQFPIIGSSSTELVHIQNEIITLVQGRTFEESELSMGGEPNQSVAIISDKTANQNDLDIGSTIILPRHVPLPLPPGEWYNNWADQFLEENLYTVIEMEVTIIGIFSIPDQTDDSDSNDDWQRIERINSIYIPNWAIEEYRRQEQAAWIASWDAVDFEPDPEWQIGGNDDEERETEVRPVFVLNDPDLIDEFKAAAADFLPPYHELIDMSGAFDDIASSMETMQNIANWILYVSIGATLLILSLLITLFLRDRRYEMGVYLALGEKKGRIISQILLEVVVTSLVGITLAVFVGHFISGTMSQNMLRNELASQQNDDPWGGGWSWDPESAAFEDIGIPRVEMTPDQMMEAFQISLGIETVGLFYAIGLGAVVLSTMVPVIYVVTLNPKKVLM